MKILSMYVIYERPKDYPQHYVLRKWDVSADSISADSGPICVVDTLKEARACVPAGLFNLGRFVADEPQIKEVWL